MDGRESDLLLIEKSKRGDESAFEALVLKHQDRVYNICRYMLGAADAEDAAQETFIKAYRNLAGFTPAPNFSAWITRIAVNTCLDYKRKHSHLSLIRTTPEGTEYAHDEASGTPGPESCLESKRTGLAVTAAIERQEPARRNKRLRQRTSDVHIAETGLRNGKKEVYQKDKKGIP